MRHLKQYNEAETSSPISQIKKKKDMYGDIDLTATSQYTSSMHAVAECAWFLLELGSDHASHAWEIQAPVLFSFFL